MKLSRYKDFDRNLKFLCEKYQIENYTINNDGSIDVNGDVDISFKDLERIPINFRNVTGEFHCDNNKLTTLEGSPIHVGKGFNCSSDNKTSNRLKNLIGAPEYVGGDFDCAYSGIKSLVGSPKYVGGVFYCDSNELSNFEGLENSKLIGKFLCVGNRIQELYNLFNDKECIEFINDFDVIQDDKIILDRLKEVYFALGLEVPRQIIINNAYEII